MINAWAIAKNAVKNFGGKASHYISIALKMAWEVAKTKVSSLDDAVIELSKNGVKASRWTKGNFDRVYVDLDTNCVGLKVWIEQSGEKLIAKSKYDNLGKNRQTVARDAMILENKFDMIENFLMSNKIENKIWASIEAGY
jgi:hypothetical protein